MRWDTRQRNIEQRAVFAGCGVWAVGTKELPVDVGGGEELVLSVWRGWWKDGD